MGTTVTLSSGSKMDFSTILSIGENGSFLQERPAVRGTYQATLMDSARKHKPRTLQYRPETTEELVSALLDDTTTMEQEAACTSKKPCVAGVSDAHAPNQTNPDVMDMSGRSNGHVARKATPRSNITNSGANRLRVSHAHSAHRRPSTSIQPKTTSRQRKGTVRYRRPSPGSSGAGSHKPVYQPAWELLDRSDLPQTRLLRPLDMPSHVKMTQANALMAQDLDSADELPDNQHKFKRKSESILGLTNALKLDPREVMAVRRSKTTREPVKSRVAKQKGVFKKMTDALADRLHLTHKAAEEVVDDIDDGRGTGFYDYETNQFIMAVRADVPTQKRQVPSRLAEIYERQEPNCEGQQTGDDSWERSAGPKIAKSSSSKGSLDDPFSAPDSKRATTDFVNRLKDSTVSKPSRDSAPATPSAKRSEMETVLNGSISSLLPFTPVGASTPRIKIDRRHSHGVDGSAQGHKNTARVSDRDLDLGVISLNDPDDESDDAYSIDSHDDMPSTGHYLAPPHGYTYLPVLNAPDRKKHPSPNKIDLELLEKRLREKWPETIAGMTEQAKKHPSPLKLDIQALGEQFRKTYPDLVSGNTPEKKKKKGGGVESTPILRLNDETDELALSFVGSTPEKPVVSRHRKALSVHCLGQAAANDEKSKRKTITVSKCASMVIPVSEMKSARLAYHQA